MTRTALTNRPLVPGHARLDDVLRRFATTSDRLAENGGTLPDDPRLRLKTLLREIDETVLPRRIDVHANGKRLAHLSVYSRRLASVEIAAKSGSTPQGGNVASDFAEMLFEITGTRGTLTYVSKRQSERQQATEFTCSVATLRALLGSDDQICDIARLTEITGPIAIAQMSWAGESGQEAFSGDATWHKLLEDHARRFRSHARSKKFDRYSGAGQAEGMAIPVTAEQIILIACLTDRGIAAIVPFEAGLKAIALWQTANSPEQEPKK